MSDFYEAVPRDLAQNLLYRLKIRERCQKDLSFRKAVMEACKHDVLYWMAAFCWCYEPRPRIVDGKKRPSVLPFIPWTNQVPAIRRIKSALGYEDIGAEKSRGEGMSWIAVLLALHDWLFDPLSAVGLVSRTEAACDSPDDPDSLMWKLDWELMKLPKWMVPEFKRTREDHNFKNLRTGSTITGYAATADVASGGRKKWFLMDELAKFPRPADREAMASTQQVTMSRFFVSTPKGNSGAYYELMHEPSNMVRIVLDWTDNETRNRGLYYLVAGHAVAVDPVLNPLPFGYEEEIKPIWDRLRKKGFKLEGKKRSPWYDRECDRPGATPQSIAQELDRDYGGSMYQVFGHDFFAKAEESVRAPEHRLIVDYNTETLEPCFDTAPDGRLSVWSPLDMQKRPPRGQYVVGVDICSGLGGSYTSNSSACVFDLMNMQQVAEYTVNTEEPTAFADSCIAICKYFYDAYLIWEMNFGGGFTIRVKKFGYPHVYYRDILFKRGRKKRQEMGWYTDERSKGAMFGDLSRAVRMGELKLRSDALVKECGQYVMLAGKIEHAQSGKTADDSSRGRSHGDRVIAACVALQGIKDRPVARNVDEDYLQNPPANTMAARQAEYEKALQTGSEDWDDRGGGDYWKE